MSNCLIKGGTVVDGTGSAAFLADVRVVDGLISEVAPDLTAADGETVHDASGCYVSPGFIETHTHYDGTMWWEPNLRPLAGFGATTTIMGNCGFAVAPLPQDPEARQEVIKIFSFFEDIPEEPFNTQMPWDWSSWSEYKKSVTEKVQIPTNYASFVGHIALRLSAMGMDAWQRAATPDEIAAMVDMLRDALDAGALGLSTNLMDHDGDDRPVPSLNADDAEFRALMEVLHEYPNRQFQVILDIFKNLTGPAALERVGKFCEGLDVRVQWVALPTLTFQRELMDIQTPMLAQHEQFKKDGRDFWAGYTHVPITSTLSVQRSLIFAQSNDYVWQEVVKAEGDDAKLALLRDEDWRERARNTWDNDVYDFSPMSPGSVRALILLNSDNGVGPIRVTLGEYSDELGVHPSDAMAEWFINNGLESTVTMPPYPVDRNVIIDAVRDPQTVGNISDAGAHGQMLCGAGENISLFTDYVRDTGDLSIEEVVHSITGKLANHMGLNELGEIKPGKRADITVFDLNEIQYQELEKVSDVPTGKGDFMWRWTRSPAPMRLTMVNGVPTFKDGDYTDAKPGEMLSPQ